MTSQKPTYSEERGVDGAAERVRWEGAVTPADFGKAAGRVFRLDEIVSADFSRIEELQASVTLRNGTTFELRDIDALELAYAIVAWHP